MDDYKKYEADCNQIKTVNQQLLTEFETWLKFNDLSAKTIKNHLLNVDFYINEYLLYEDAIEAQEGVNGDHISDFLGYWFIKKAMWASKSSIKSMAASLKKFYSFLLEQGLIESDALQELKETIKDEMDEWLETMERYDDPSMESTEDVWGF